jgi:hypothetical protein
MNSYLRTAVGTMIATVAAAALLVVSAAGTPAEAKPLSQHEHSAPSAAADAHPGTAATPDMMAMRQQMKAEHSAADEKLRVLVERMKAATGQARQDAMAAVVLELVAERSAMRAHMDRMSAMPEMMHGQPSETRKMSEQCPMMKGATPPAKP